MVVSELRALDPADAPDDDDESDGESDGAGPSALSALQHSLRTSARPLSAVAGVFVLVGWSAMMWSVVTSIAAIDESIGALALQVSEQQACPGPAALESTLAEAQTDAAPPASSLMFEGEVEPSPEPTPAFPATLFGWPVVTDGADLWNCTDFETQQQAQMVYEANLPDDPNILDFDANGTPCDSLLPNGPNN